MDMVAQDLIWNETDYQDYQHSAYQTKQLSREQNVTLKINISAPQCKKSGYL